MKNAASSAESGAPPERTIFTRPPRRARILLKTSLSAIADLIFRPSGIDLPVTRYGSEEIRPHFAQVLADFHDTLGIGDRAAAVEVGVVTHPFQDVRERQDG